MKRSSVPTVLYLAVVFLSGGLLGVFADRLYTTEIVRAGKDKKPQTPAEFRKRYVDDMNARLKMTPEQLTSLTQILDQTRAKYHDLHERSKPEMKAIHDDQVLKIRAILNDTQRTEYEKMLAEREERRKKSPGPPPGGF